jgi:hypothetical protein
LIEFLVKKKNKIQKLKLFFSLRFDQGKKIRNKKLFCLSKVRLKKIRNKNLFFFRFD